MYQNDETLLTALTTVFFFPAYTCLKLLCVAVAAWCNAPTTAVMRSELLHAYFGEEASWSGGH